MFDMMFTLGLVVLLGGIFLGIRLGGIGVAYAGGIGVAILTLVLGFPAGSIPVDVILIILSVVATIAAMQAAGGLDYLVQIAARILRNNPQHINFLAPFVTYIMTVFAGTGHTAYSVMPVIVEVSKRQKIAPKYPLSSAAVASQIAITASPFAAAVAALSGFLNPFGVTYPVILAVAIPSTLVATMISAWVISLVSKIKDDSASIDFSQYASDVSSVDQVLRPGAKLSVMLFAVGLLLVVCLAAFPILNQSGLKTAHLIIVTMMSIGFSITMFCKINPSHILDMSTFKAGLSAAICILGVAWLGTTFVEYYTDNIKELASGFMQSMPFMLAFVFFFTSMLLYSQGATTVAMVPLALSIGIDSLIILASFPAVSALFVLPTYPTVLAAVAMDDTGSTKIGKYIFNHSFMLPGVLNITFAVVLGYFIGSFLI